jgi:hypothetical protein
MQVTHSLTLIAAAGAATDDGNAYFEGLGWGTPVLAIALSPDGQLPITAYAAHDMRTGEVVSTLLAAQESDDPALDGLDGVLLYPVESASSEFEAALISAEVVAAFGSTLQLYQPPFES